jgi:Ca2+-binding RTX toxin-like protein
MSIATGQVTGALAFNTVAAGGVLAITQTTVGTAAAPAVLSLASATFPTFNYLGNTGTSTAGITLTAGGTLLIGSTGVDSITGSTLADTITGGTGADTLAGGGAADQFVYAASAAQLVTYAGADTTTANIERITDFTAAADSIRIVSGSLFAGITPTTTSGAGGASAGFVVNESGAGVLGAAPIAIAAGATSITALTALFETAAGGVLSTIGIAAAATGLQAYTFATAAGTGAFDGRVYLVINNATAALAADDVIIELTGITGNFAATNFSIS